MPLPKPKQSLKPSVPPPPKPAPLAGPTSGRVPPPSMPPPRAAPSSIPPARLSATTAPVVPAPALPVLAVAAELPAPKEVSQYYIKVGDQVRTLDLEQIQTGLDLRTIRDEGLICEVGGTTWRSLREASGLGLRFPEPSALSIDDSELFEEEEPSAASETPLEAGISKTGTSPAAPLVTHGVKPGLGSRIWASESKGTWAVWGLAMMLAGSVVLQRTGTLHAMAQGVGQGPGYEKIETDLIGGPGKHTVRGVKQTLTRLKSTVALPFSTVEARAKGQASSSP